MLDGTHASTSACPDANVLAAYIDGRLAPTARQEVDAHLADCDDCYEVSVETVRIHREVQQQRFFTAGTLTLIATLVALAATLAFFLLRT
jgi:anti-sigma factor RsiW